MRVATAGLAPLASRMPSKVASDDILAQVARDVGKLQSRVQMLESITRPQAKTRIAEIFKTDVSVAVVLWLPRADSQADLARLVSKSIGRKVLQKTMSRELIRLKTQGILGRTKAGAFFVEESWNDVRLDAELRQKGKAMGVKVAPKRRKVTR